MIKAPRFWYLAVCGHSTKMRRCRRTAPAFATDCSGAVAVPAAIALLVILGFAGLGSEAASWYVAKRSMQGAADTAASSAAYARGSESIGGRLHFRGNERRRQLWLRGRQRRGDRDGQQSTCLRQPCRRQHGRRGHHHATAAAGFRRPFPERASNHQGARGGITRCNGLRARARPRQRHRCDR